LKTTTIVLAGGQSTRLGQDKGLLVLANKPLVRHVLDAVGRITDEILLVVSSKAQTDNYSKILTPNMKVLIDHEKIGSPLAGASTGFQEASGDYSLLLACDTPLVSREIIALLLELCINKAAAIPRWPNGYVEPLQAAYHTKSALKASEAAINEGGVRMQCMVDKLRGVRYVSTLVLQQLDPELATFFNVNTQMDLAKAKIIMNKRRKGVNAV
jgi:molybdopterin-guanine dinucleotide biosynthesis protein A